MKLLYRLEHVKYYFFDKIENENVEERFILGHFSSLEKLNEAISICLKNGFCEQELSISTFFDKFTHNQKYVYVLSYQYSIINENGTYIDYEYIFNPFSNKAKCISLMHALKEDSKYNEKPNKIYDKQSMKGFYISKQIINHLYGIPKNNFGETGGRQGTVPRLQTTNIKKETGEGSSETGDSSSSPNN